MEHGEANQEGGEKVVITPRLHLSGLDETSLEFANVIQMSHDHYGFHMVLAQLPAPLVLSQEDRLAIIRDGVQARVVGRYFVSPAAVREFIEIMAAQLQRFEASYGPLPNVPDVVEEDSQDGI